MALPLIGVFSIAKRGQVHDLLRFVDFVKEPPGSDAISPGLWFPLPQLIDIGAEMGLVSQLRIHVTEKLGLDFRPDHGWQTIKVLQEDARLKDPIARQRNGPIWLWRRGIPFSTGPEGPCPHGFPAFPYR